MLLFKNSGFVMVCALMVASCGEEAKRQDGLMEPPEAIASRKAEYAREQSEFAAIEYPNCAQVWSGEKLSPCGIKRLEKALDSCGEREGTGTKLDAMSAGDTWIYRAGRNSVRTLRERSQHITESDITVEPVAYLMGDNTDGIKVVQCYMDRDMKLTSTGYVMK